MTAAARIALAPPPAPPPLPAPVVRLVRAFVAELLAWDAALARIEIAAGASASTWLLGVTPGPDGRLWVGTGCRGTKGVGRLAPREPDRVLAADPLAAARYAALRGPDLRVADAVLADGQGDRVVELAFGNRSLACSFAARIGLRLAPDADVHRWHRKILLERDSRPALEGAERHAWPLLGSAAEAWHAL